MAYIFLPVQSNFMTTQSNGRNCTAAVEIKGSSVTLPIVRLLNADTAAVITQLQERIDQAPDFFRGAPVVVDLSALADEQHIDLETLVKELRQLEMIPVGLRGGSEALRQSARSLNLACLAESAIPEPRPQKPDTKVQPVESPKPEAQTTSPPPASHALLITQPVRSGQRVYAKGTDLIVMSSVGYGAEIMADGHIHVYNTLRGRALAGVHGDTECRIFCRDMQAELVSIAGHYRISDDLEEEVRGKSVQIYMRDSALIIESF